MELSKRRNAPHITHTENNKTALLSVKFHFFSLAATNRVFIIKLHDEQKELGEDKKELEILLKEK